MLVMDENEGATSEQRRNATYGELRENCRQEVLGELVAKMLSSQVAGIGNMPRYLGLSRLQFRHMMEECFQGVELERFDRCGTILDPQRGDEHAELRELFISHADTEASTAEWVADILIAGCMGGNHLWQDLGLWSRKDLSALIRFAFAPLADKNIHDMKWKKFFYKQLCIQEGVYTCRAPSCQVCSDYQECFGPEE